MTFDWSVIWDARYQFLSGAGMTVMLAVTTMALAIPGGLLLAFLRLVPLAPGAMVRLGLRRVLPGDAARAADLLGLLRAAGAGRYPAAGGDDRPRRPDLQRLGLQFRNIPGGHPVDPARPGECRPGARHGRHPGDAPHRAAAGGDADIALPRQHLGSLFKDTSLVSVIAVPELSYVALKVRADTYRILEVLTAMAVLYWLMGYPQAKLVDWIHRRFKVAE